jgi:hypothetical protein
MSLFYDHGTVPYVKNSTEDIITRFDVRIFNVIKHYMGRISGVRTVKCTHPIFNTRWRLLLTHHFQSLCSLYPLFSDLEGVIDRKIPVFAGNQISVFQLSIGHFVLCYLLRPAALRL